MVCGFTVYGLQLVSVIARNEAICRYEKDYFVPRNDGFSFCSNL